MMNRRMPSPIGHALAGVATAWTLEPSDSPQAQPPSAALTATAAMLGMLPDLDLVYSPIHRTVTHSVFAALLVIIVAAGVTGWVTGLFRWRIALVCGAAYASHIVLDWLGADSSRPYGLQLFWPVDDGWYIAPIAIFPGTQRYAVLSAQSMVVNARAILAEVAICGPVVLLLALRRRRRSRGRTSGQAVPPPPSV
jgi:membrane-bound metal-dependent hydrolase YbcI (DUF457 family)